MKEIYKKGQSVVTMPIMLIFSIACIIVITINCINMITPFLWYQKLQLIVTKYMYVIDKFGYLTGKEEQQMMKELSKEGFKTSNITISVPRTKRQYGELLEVIVRYRLNYNAVSLIGKNSKNITLTIRKYSYSKI